MKRTSQTRGFTLVELMVVVAILAVLASLLFAVFSRVREKGRSTACQSNLHQVGLAMQMYTDNYNGLFPPSSNGKLAMVEFWPDNITPYLRSKQVLQCPTLKSYWEVGVPAQHYFMNVNRLNYSPSEAQQNAGVGWLPRHESRIIDAVRVWMVREGGTMHFEEQPDEGACGNLFYTWSVHHNGGGNYVFVDGHVKWLNPQQIDNLDCSLPRNDMFSPA